MVLALYFLQGNAAERWPSAWTNLLYINNYVRDYYMGYIWSLAIEEQFMLLSLF